MVPTDDDRSQFWFFYISVQAEDRKVVLIALSCTSCYGTHGLCPGAIYSLYGKSL